MIEITHPKAIEARRRAEQRAKERELAREIIRQATAQGVRFVEILPQNYETNRPKKIGRMTVAYKALRRDVIAVSTALCHPDDDFDKSVGRARSATSMAEGYYILMRVPQKVTPREWINSAFDGSSF